LQPTREETLARLRADAHCAWQAGLRAVDPEKCVRRALAARADLRGEAARTLIVAVGKAAAGMMRGAVVADRDGAAAMPGARAIVLLPEGSDAGQLPAGTIVLRGGHPWPTPGGIAATERIVAEVSALGHGSRLLVLLSGGASALLEAPLPGVSVAELIAAHRRLVASGLPIRSINLERAARSAVKAGRLLEKAHPAHVTTLAISDVEGDDPAVIGSGPTVPPSGKAGIDYAVIASVADAVAAARDELVRLGYDVGADAAYLHGRTEVAADLVARALDSLVAASDGRPRAAVFGGETTVAVTVAYPGCGGRNLDLAARTALALQGRDGMVVAVAGTDGADGSSRAAGALVDGGTAARARRAGRPLADALAAFDTEPALEAAGDLLVTGPTGTNVGDLVVAVARRPGSAVVRGIP